MRVLRLVNKLLGKSTNILEYIFLLKEMYIHNKMPYVKSKIACKELGVSDATLRNWAKQGRIKFIRNGERSCRLYDIESIQPEMLTVATVETEKKKYIYCRVSSGKQKEDLQRQIKYLKTIYPDHYVVKDIASGINFERKALTKLLDESLRGMVSEIVVANRDRLCRIAWKHFEWLFQRLGVNLVVEDQQDLNPEEELKDDLMSIVHVFSCRHYGQRRKSRAAVLSGKIQTLQTEKGESSPRQSNEEQSGKREEENTGK